MYGVDILGNLSQDQIKEKEEYMKLLCKKLGLSEMIEKLDNGYNSIVSD